MKGHEEIELLKTGSVVEFKVIGETIRACTDAQEAYSEVKLMLLDDDEEDGYQTVEWGAFGFLYFIAYFSFKDARPRNTSEIDYEENDYFTVSDMVSCLSFVNGKLKFYCDYLRGRLVKTDISIEPNGKVEIQTISRGNALKRWLQKFQGKATLQSVATK